MSQTQSRAVPLLLHRLQARKSPKQVAGLIHPGGYARKTPRISGKLRNERRAIDCTGPRLLFIPQWQRPLSYPKKAACAILKANFSTSPHTTRAPLVRVRSSEPGSAHLAAVSVSTLSRRWTSAPLGLPAAPATATATCAHSPPAARRRDGREPTLRHAAHEPGCL